MPPENPNINEVLKNIRDRLEKLDTRLDTPTYTDHSEGEASLTRRNREDRLIPWHMHEHTGTGLRYPILVKHEDRLIPGKLARGICDFILGHEIMKFLHILGEGHVTLS